MSTIREVTLIIRFLLLAVALVVPVGVSGQNPPKADSAGYAPKPSAPSIDFSGIIFANYQYRTEDAADDANKFDVERAYLTLRASAGERTSVRVTTDVYQQTSSTGDAFYRGWAIRAKYAYLQYNYLSGTPVTAAARIGLLHTVFIEHDETFWPRWIGNSPTEKAGYFSSADAGIATSITLPKKSGEIYSTITNGPGYTSRETDRFKDFAARLTLTPFASGSSLLRTVALSAWVYKGALASRFVNGGPGQAGTVGESLQRDRWGVHAGGATPRFTFGAQYAQRIDQGETGANTVGSPRAVVDSTGTLASAYAILRPLMLLNPRHTHPLSLIARWDRVTTNADTEDAYDFFVAGAIWDFSSRASISLDYQETTSARGNPTAHARTWFAHFVARF